MLTKTATITTSAAKPHSRPMSSFFGLCFGPISGEETPPPGAGAYQSPWPWGASGAGMPQTVQKRAPGASRLPQRGQMPGPNGAAAPVWGAPAAPCCGGTDCAGPAEADRVVSDGADGSGAGAPQLVQKRTPSSSGAPHFVQVRGAAGCVDAVGSAKLGCLSGYGAFRGDGLLGQHGAAGAADHGAVRQLRAAFRAEHGKTSFLFRIFSHCNIRLSILQSILCVLYSHYLLF